VSATYQRLRNFLAYLTPERRSNYAGCLFAVRSHETASLMTAPLSLFCALQGLTLLTGCFVCGRGTVQRLVVAQVGEGTSRDVASDGMVQQAANRSDARWIGRGPLNDALCFFMTQGEDRGGLQGEWRARG